MCKYTELQNNRNKNSVLIPVFEYDFQKRVSEFGTQFIS